MLFDIHGDIFTDIAKKRIAGDSDVLKKYHFERFTQGQMSGGVFIVWVDPPHDVNPKKRFWEIIKNGSIELFENRDFLTVIYDKAGYEQAVQDGKFAVVMGIEGLSAIEDDLKLLYSLHRMGFRHASLTWNEENALATGVRGPNQERGLTDQGRKAIDILEKLGWVIDVSHLNEASFWGVIKHVKGPIIASHSNAKAICNVPRNLTDEQILAIGKTGGLVGINAFNEFIHADQEFRTVDTLIDHIDHVRDLIGIDKIALGFDFFEYIDQSTSNTFTNEPYKGTIGLEDITKGPELIRKLQERGYGEEGIRKIAHENFLNLLERIKK